MIYFVLLHLALIALLARNFYLEQMIEKKKQETQQLCKAYDRHLQKQDQDLSKVLDYFYDKNR